MDLKISTLRFINVATAILLLTACSKNEQPIKEPNFSGLLLQAVTADEFRLKVTDGGTELTNNLNSSSARPLTVLSTYYNPLHQIKVYNFYNGELLLDTVMLFRGTPYTITFYQSNTGGKLRWIGPPVNEPLAGEGNLKISIIYTAPLLPSSLKVVVENTVSEISDVYEPTDSLVLEKGVFSRYFTGRNLRTKKPRLSLYTTGSDRKLIATISPGEFLETNRDYSVFLFDKASGGGVFALDSKKIY